MPTFYLDSGGAADNSGTTDGNSATASGTSNATILANKTFVSLTDVDATNNVVTVTGHGYSTGMGIMLTTSSALPNGLAATTLYFLRAIDANTLAFYLTAADAGADTNRVDFTTTGTGTQTINNYTVQLGGSPDLSGVVGATHCRITTGTTTHVITFDVAHGISTGDACIFRRGAPSGGSTQVIYYANALSSTTIRLYASVEGAQAGGTSTVSLGVQATTASDIARANTQYIKLASATNTNRKTFMIRWVDNTNDWVVVDTTVTGLGAGSNWAIGGRVSASGAVDLFNTLSSFDTCVLNTDISAGLNLVYRNPFGLVGACAIRGKAGARRVLTNTGNGTLLTTTSSGQRLLCENIEFQSQGTGAAFSVAGILGQAHEIVNCRITDSGTFGIGAGSGSVIGVFDCEVTGCATDGINGPTSVTSTFYIAGCYIHDNGSDGIEGGGMFLMVADTIIERNTAHGITTDTSTNAEIWTYLSGCTIYRNGGNGYNVVATVIGTDRFLCRDTIFKDNGNVSTEGNVVWTNGLMSVYSARNVYNVSGGLGGSNLLAGGLAASATDLTSDPLFNDPDNGTVASRDFGLQTGSPAKDAAYAFPGGGSTSHRDRGAVQSSGSASGGMLQANKRGNMQ